MSNPFTATFGVSPPLLVGRDALLADFDEAIDDGPGAGGRATLYTGARGSGKTVMLNAVEDRARSKGWLVLSDTASPGFVHRMTHQQLPRLLRQFDPAAVQRRLTGLTGPVSSGAVTWQTIERHLPEIGLRDQLEVLTGLLQEHETGVLITVDEIHPKQVSELRELAVTIQHAFREGRQVAFTGAGLASSVSDLTNDDVLTFLRRAERHSLGAVSSSDVERGFLEPILDAGRRIDDDALSLMVRATGGYPFMLQLIGAQTWRVDSGSEMISLADARTGVARARQRLASLVHEPAMTATSEVDRAFLQAMAIDDGPSSMVDIRERLGVDAVYAGQYRLRLIAAELIHAAGYGKVDFALPYLREYVRSIGT